MVSHHKMDSIQITDSIYGEISIPKVYFQNFIDTCHFQRLRRIEQTMARALYPSSRHDRFTHSLGVYHIGHLIVGSLRAARPARARSGDGSPGARYDSAEQRVFTTYELACLLHDVGHSPFSHSFEEFFDCPAGEDGVMLTRLTLLLIHRLEELQGGRDEELRRDCLRYIGRAAPHERMSAYLSARLFADAIGECGADVGLLARMIIGCRYHEGEQMAAGGPTPDQLHKSFCNAMIELIHGDVVDADGIDYVLRDTWSAGYATTSVDYQRLIRHIMLRRDNGGKGLWQLCFSHVAIPEIRSVLANKTFEQTSVYPHNTLVLDRHLLIEGMKAAARYHYGLESEVTDAALRQLCDVDAYVRPHTLPRHHLCFYLPQDDDFVTLMKWLPAEPHIRQWLSHNYDVEPLWLSIAEFYDLFGEPLTALLDEAREDAEAETGAQRADQDEAKLISEAQRRAVRAYCEAQVRAIEQQYPALAGRVLLLEARHTTKDSRLLEANIFIHRRIQRYVDLFPEDKPLLTMRPRPFFYIFVPKDAKQEVLRFIRPRKKRRSSCSRGSSSSSPRPSR